MTDIIQIGKRSNLYPNIVYTPASKPVVSVDIQENITNPLDWAREVVSTTVKDILESTSDNTEPESDSKSESSGSYWDAWKDDKKKEDSKDKEDSDKKAETDSKPKTITYKGRGYEDFKSNYEKSGIDPKRFEFFASLAKHESNFNPTVQNKAGAPAFGYFQFMQDGKKWNNISKFAGVDVSAFRNNPVLQIKAAERLADTFLSQFTEEDRKRARELGYSDSALVRGAWLGGVGGVRNFLHKGINADDKHWDKKDHKGSSIKEAMDRGNNYFKYGGVLNANL